MWSCGIQDIKGLSVQDSTGQEMQKREKMRPGSKCVNVCATSRGGNIELKGKNEIMTECVCVCVWSQCLCKCV